MQIRLHNILMHTKVLGPGTRTAIWFQGCKRVCPRCMSPTSRPMNGGRVVEADDLINAIIDVKGDIEGVTISGGEPFLQIDGLYYLLEALRRQTDLGVIIYTGFTIEQLRELESSKIERVLTGMADLIIDGEYVDELNDGVALRGSSNQKLCFLTERYKKEIDSYENNVRNAEVVATDKELFFVGIPSRNMLKEWKEVAKDFQQNKT